MDFNHITPSNAVFVNVKATSKKNVLQELSHRAADIIGVEFRELLSELTDREQLGSTGVGRGVAIPHCRLDSVDRVHGFLVRLDQPAPFDSVDGEPVDLVFLLVAPTTASSDHLKALAKVSRILRDSETCAKMRGAKDAAALHALLTTPERSQAA